MFCALGLIFCGTKVVGSRFHVLRAHTRFSAVSRASGHFFMFCSLGHVFGGTEDVGFLFHILRVRRHSRRYRGCWVLFSCFACPESFSAVPRASGPVFMFCMPGLIFGGSEGVGTRFHLLRARIHFRRCRASGPLSMFCGSGIVFGGTEGVGSRFHVLRALTHFRRYRGRRVPFFMFCSPGLVFGGTMGVGSPFHVLRDQTYFRRNRGRRVPFSCFAGTE
jgi:hypothetical protein